MIQNFVQRILIYRTKNIKAGFKNVNVILRRFCVKSNLLCVNICTYFTPNQI